MLLCTCLALNLHVTRYAKLKLMPQIGNVANVSSYNVVKHKLNDNLYCDHCMNLPGDAVTLLMVITLVCLIYMHACI